jgi:hypothetical protein
MANQTVQIVIRARDMASRVISGTNRTLKQLNVSARGIGQAFTAVGATAVGLGFVSAKLFDIGASALETRSKLDTVFGDSKDRVRAFGDSFSETAGLVRRAGEDILATTGAIVQGMGYTQSASADAAISVVKLAGDIASFNDRKTADVALAIQGAITGEREMLKRLGIVIREVDVQQRAMVNSGKRAAGALTQQEKATATLQLISERAGVAVGDLDRTFNSAANTARRVRARFGNIAEDFAVKLIPVLSNMLPLLDQLASKVAGMTDPFVTFIKRSLDAMGLYSQIAEGTADSMAAVAHNTELVIQREKELAAEIERVSVAFVEAEAAMISARLGGGASDAAIEAGRAYRELRAELAELREEYIAVGAAAATAQSALDAADAALLSQFVADRRGGGGGGGGGAPTQGKIDERKEIEAETHAAQQERLEASRRLRAEMDKRAIVEAETAYSIKLAGEKRAEAQRMDAEQAKRALYKRLDAERLATGAVQDTALNVKSFAISLMNAGAQIIQIARGGGGGGFFGKLGQIAGVAGSVAALIPGGQLIGAGLALGGAALQSAAGGGAQADIPVRVQSYSPAALDSLERRIGPDRYTQQILSPDTGEVLDQIIYEIGRREAADANPRFPNMGGR